MTFSDLDITIPQGRTTGQVYTTCPRCSQDRKKKTAKCLSVNLDQGIWNCQHCKWHGSLHKKQYALPKWENPTGLPDKMVEWFQQRNIASQTLADMQVTQTMTWMPQVQKERSVICFNYFRDGHLVNIKYRDGEKNFKLFKDAELIFYNLDGIKDAREAWIVEGEIDCLTMIQAGYKNTVSVPNGANRKQNNLDYLDNCYTYFEKIEKVFILTDNDEPGEQLAQELARRIGVEKCYRVNVQPYKDVNEQLCKTGRVDVSQATAFPIAGIFSIEDHWAAFELIRKYGFPKGWKPRGSLGDLIQFFPGFITVITGIPGHGKSEIIDQVLMQICVDYNLKGSFFTPENWPTEVHLLKLVEKLSGKTVWGSVIGEREMEIVKAFLTNRVFWIYPEEDFSVETLLNKVRQAVLKYGINWFVFDPWNKLEHLDDSTGYVGRVLDLISNFCKKNLVHCFLVAHPTKMKFNYDKGVYEIPGLYDISGSSNFYNKADLGLSMYKDSDGESTLYVQKVKFKYWGKVGSVHYRWNKENGRYDEYGQDVSNWLMKQAEAKLIDFSEPRKTGTDDLPF